MSRLHPGDTVPGERAGLLQGLDLLVPLQGGLKLPSHAAGSGKPRGGRRVARRATKRAGFAHATRDRYAEWCRPACRALGRRKRTSLSTRCSEARVPPERTSARGALRFGRSQRPPGGPIPGSSQLRAGTHRSARTGEEAVARHPLLMEWAGADSHLVCTPLLSAPGGERGEGRTPNHCVFSAGHERTCERQVFPQKAHVSTGYSCWNFSRFS